MWTTMAFAAGVAVGWTGRSFVSSTREALVQAVTLGHKARAVLHRVGAERFEWLEDVAAEGRARFDEQQSAHAPDDEAPPRVVDTDDSRPWAA